MSNHPWMSAPSRLWTTAFAALALGVATPTVAYAQDKDCPPGSWFCGETQPPPTGENKDLQPLPEAKPAPAPAPTQPPPVVVYQPPTQAVVVQPREAPPPYVYVPRTPPKKTEWGINLHLGGAMIGTGRSGDASMGVVGIGLRVRPIPQLALEGDIDVAGGTDYNGLDRSEVAYTLNGLLFVNPKDKVQVYFVGGLGFASARARAADYDTSFASPTYRYGYFGVQGGLGLEFRLSKVVALNTDLRGIYRGRIDSHRDEYPEFVSSDGRTTNKSGAGLFQVGITFYW